MAAALDAAATVDTFIFSGMLALREKKRKMVVNEVV